VQIQDAGLALRNQEDLMRADLLASVAADTELLLQLEGDDIFQIPESLHG
jgi:hypothetical protein